MRTLTKAVDQLATTAGLFVILLGAHAVSDCPLQNEFLSRAKNRYAPTPGVPWFYALGAHGAVHGLAVALVTRSPALGVAEALMHAVIDDAKCAGRLNHHQDQALHASCKVVWAIMARHKRG